MYTVMICPALLQVFSPADVRLLEYGLDRFSACSRPDLPFMAVIAWPWRYVPRPAATLYLGIEAEVQVRIGPQLGPTCIVENVENIG